jgi:hypothetical protein
VVGWTLARTQTNAAAQGQTIVWGDESGFYLLPAKVRTSAPGGQTPILHVPLTREQLSAISAVTAHGRLCMRVQRCA